MVKDIYKNERDSPLRFANSTEEPKGEQDFDGPPSATAVERRHTVGGGDENSNQMK